MSMWTNPDMLDALDEGYRRARRRYRRRYAFWFVGGVLLGGVPSILRMVL